MSTQPLLIPHCHERSSVIAPLLSASSTSIYSSSSLSSSSFKMFDSKVRYQFLATICGNIISIGYGTVCGWPSASLITLQSNESPLSTGPLTINEASWVGSLTCIGGFFGSFLFAWLSNLYGRKKSMILSAIPQLLGWLLIIYATNPIYLYVSRTLSGIAAGGVFFIMPLFVTEISNDNVRGALGSLQFFSCNVGIVISFIMGDILSYQMTPILLITIPVLFLAIFSYFPETPQYLLQCDREDEAKESLKFYKNISSADSEELTREMWKLKQNSTKNKCDTIEAATLTFNDFNNRVARKSLEIGFVLIGLNQLCGAFTMINYTAAIFAESGSNLTPTMSAIIISVLQLFGVVFSTMFADRFGRKFLLGISSFGCGIGHLVLGTYIYLTTSLGYEFHGFEWIPIISFAFTMFIAAWGILSIPFTVIAEVLPEKIRPFGLSLMINISWMLAFSMVKTFPYLTIYLGMHGCIFIFGFFSILGAIYIIFLLPETKGKSFNEIMELLAV